MNILSIEDDATFAGWCHRMLQTSGIPVQSFTTIKDVTPALEWIGQGNTPSLILLDLNLAQTTGDGTISLIPMLDDIAPVVIVSGIGCGQDIESDSLAKCYAAGAVGHVFKMALHPHCAGMIAGIMVSAGYNWKRIHHDGR